jgi:hypothetical protein
MMHGSVLIRWGANIPGREAAALDVFGRAIMRFEQLTKEGRIHGHREYISVTGRDGGFALMEGEVEELTKILTEEETLKLNNQASAIVQDFEVQAFLGGTDQAIQQLIGTYTASLNEIGYMQ